MKKKITIFILSILILIFIISIIVSLDRFGVWNPISTLCGILKINLTDNEYTIVQNKPNTVIFIKPDYETNDPREVLNKYMNVDMRRLKKMKWRETKYILMERVIY